MSVQFGAQVVVNNLHPNHNDVQQKIRSKANKLRTQYAQYGDDQLRIDLSGQQVLWTRRNGKLTGTYSPSIMASIQVRSPKNGRILSDEVTRKISIEFSDEPLWKFFWRVRRETNRLIKAASLKPEQK